MQSVNVMEPILNARRGILTLMMEKIGHEAISNLYLKSSRLARYAGHLELAWSHLIRAKEFCVNRFEVAMEEARYLFQKACFFTL